MKLREDIDLFRALGKEFGHEVSAVKCNIIQITRKRIKKITASFTLEGTVLDNVAPLNFSNILDSNAFFYITFPQGKKNKIQ